jgi:hypothetical protein
MTARPAWRPSATRNARFHLLRLALPDQLVEIAAHVDLTL